MADQIDSHHHLWQYIPAQYPWIDGRMGVIKRDFTPEDFESEMRSAGIGGSIAVQARETLEETTTLLDHANSHPFIKGVVGWVPLTSPHVRDHLDRLGHEPNLKGVRHILHDEPDDHYVLRPDFNAGVSQLLSYRLVYDILIFEKHLPQTLEFVDRHPNQVFVLDHIAKPRIRDGEISQWSRILRELARREHVYCKLSGVVTEANWQNWREEKVDGYIGEALAAFGPSRMMFGSDWPVLLVASSYREWVETVRRSIDTLTADEQAAIMGRTAKRVYRL